MSIVHRHVEAVGVVFAVGDAGDHAVALAVDAARSGRKGPRPAWPCSVKFMPRLLAGLGRSGARMWPMISRPRLLGLARSRRGAAPISAFSVSARPMKPMVSVPCLSTSRTSSFQAELLGVQPHALAHEEGVVAHASCGLDLEALAAAGRCTRSILRSRSSKNSSMSPLALMARRGRLMEVKLRLPRPLADLAGRDRRRCP